MSASTRPRAPNSSSAFVGFDAEQIERSLAIDLDEQQLLRGGSTITQQVVKNVYLGHARTVDRRQRWGTDGRCL
jgi:membrane carboxypeptidase/penicillin-binding protein